MCDDWDVDSYKNEFENEEHWELRRNFMLAHKNKFSEDELVCLAQVFTNIEFLGCRYPEKTMIRVAELAKGVVESFREKRKDSLKRTFVAASDAASAKVKGQIAKGKESKGYQAREKKRGKTRTKNKRGKTQTKNKRGKTQTKNKRGKTQTKNKSTNYCNFSVNNIETNDSKRFKHGVEKGVFGLNRQVGKQLVAESEKKSADVIEVQDESHPLVTNGELGNFVLVLSDEWEHPINVIQMNASLNKCSIRWELEHQIRTCKLFLNEKLVGMGTGRSAKISKEEAAKVALTKLRESHYGIRVKPQLENSPVGPSELGFSSEMPLGELGLCSEMPLGEDNIGRKLMKLMGWRGGGLGSKEQGREQPVAATLNVRRDGLGLKNNSFGIREFRKQAKAYIHSWAKSDSEGKLVFSANFTEEERKVMHEIAKSFSLKSKSYGKEKNRHLVISRKPDPQKILQHLLKLGGNSDRYELLMPTKF